MLTRSTNDHYVEDSKTAKTLVLATICISSQHNTAFIVPDTRHAGNEGDIEPRKWEANGQ